jgi:DNA-binding CsgD family transcriptional regulator
LSDREREVTQLILRGHSSQSICFNLGISLGTVKTHRKNAYAKLNISSQSELLSLFLQSLQAP